MDAAFDTLRRRLGLSIVEVGAVCALGGRPISEKTVRRWITGERDPPGDAFSALESLADRIEELIQSELHRMQFPTSMTLLRYRSEEALAASGIADVPLGSHAMIVAHIADALRSDGCEVRIEWAGSAAADCPI